MGGRGKSVGASAGGGARGAGGGSAPDAEMADLQGRYERAVAESVQAQKDREALERSQYGGRPFSKQQMRDIEARIADADRRAVAYQRAIDERRSATRASAAAARAAGKQK